MTQENSIEDRLNAVTIGERTSLQGTIHLDEYNPQWSTHFEDLKVGILTALGSSVVKLEHVGSTSIIGMPAKPIIDMVLEVEDATQEELYVQPLEAIGYTLRIREPDWFEHRLLKSSRIAGNLHVFSHGCSESQRMIVFRDWLNSHPDDFQRYKKTKQALAQKIWQYTQEYADAKSEVVMAILTRALAQ